MKAGETVLWQGTGGVSLFALQFAKMMGARAILTSSSDEKLDRARQLGADNGINYKSVPDWEEKVLALTVGRGVDRVVEVGGSNTLSKSLQAVRFNGQIALIGVLTGMTGDVNTSAILHKHVRVQGIYVGSRDIFKDMNRAMSIDKPLGGYAQKKDLSHYRSSLSLYRSQSSDSLLRKPRTLR